MIDIDQYFAAHSRVANEAVRALRSDAHAAGAAMLNSLKSGGKVLCFGNGGSSSQASHMAGELTGRFSANRKSLPAISLTADAGTVSCISNDFGFDEVFARQITAFTKAGDVALALTTSGKSPNVLRGIAAAQKAGAVTIALTGEAGLRDGTADFVLKVPSAVTAHIQEMHLMLLHYWCIMVDEAFA